MGAVQSPIGSAVSDYLLLPSLGSTPEINWKCVNSLLFPSQALGDKHMDWCSTQDRKRSVNTKNGLVCSCMLENSLVFTPHNGYIYCVTGFLDKLDCNSLLGMRTGESITYIEYYKKRFVQLASDFLVHLFHISSFGFKILSKMRFTDMGLTYALKKNRFLGENIFVRCTITFKDAEYRRLKV